MYAALGFSEELGIPYYPAFVRNHYIGRTFIQPSQRIRDFNVRVKLNLIGDAVRGKRVVVVDDSIVRGTTARARVVNLREAGAAEVHMRISCPPHKHACFYGIDFPDPEKLLANQCTHEEIRKYLGAGFARIPAGRRHGARHRPAEGKLLHGPASTGTIRSPTTRISINSSWRKAALAPVSLKKNPVFYETLASKGPTPKPASTPISATKSKRESTPSSAPRTDLRCSAASAVSAACSVRTSRA